MSSRLAALILEDDGIEELVVGHRERFERLQRILVDLHRFGINQGYTTNQINTALENLFETFATSWLLYVLIGSPKITDDIQNDATLGWLDTDVSGTTLRQRLINRLT